jgi:hypothetical protein
MPIPADSKAGTRTEGMLAWFRLNVTDVNRQAQTFHGLVRTFDSERHLLAKNAFAKTVSERGRVIPLLDGDHCQIGELTVMKRDSGVLSVQGKLWSCLDREFLKALPMAGRIALRIDILQRNGEQATEVRLHSAMLPKRI